MNNLFHDIGFYKDEQKIVRNIILQITILTDFRLKLLELPSVKALFLYTFNMLSYNE